MSNKQVNRKQMPQFRSSIEPIIISHNRFLFVNSVRLDQLNLFRNLSTILKKYLVKNYIM